MKTKMLWFILGFVFSWFLWSGIAAYRTMPKDLTREWPERSRAMADAEILSWTKSAQGGGLGKFSFWVPSKGQGAAAEIFPTEVPKFPLILIHDSKKRGRMDGMFITDTKQRGFSFSDDDGDGSIDSFGYTTGYGADGVSWHDQNMDGSYDLKFGPGHGMEVNIDGTWYKLIREKGGPLVQTRAGLKKVVSKNGVWVFDKSP